jgi:hypothetical protein
MTPVLTRPRPAPPQHRGHLATLLLAAAVGAVAILVAGPATRLPSFVDRVTVVNPHPWDVEVDVTGSADDGAVGLASLDRESARTIPAVVDQGDSWVFRFAYGGVEGSELGVSRAELQRAGWKVTVPDTFAARMRAAGLPPSKR